MSEQATGLTFRSTKAYQHNAPLSNANNYNSMNVKQPVAPLKAQQKSELSILLFSFVIAIVSGILIVSTLFFTVKKIGGKQNYAVDITYSKR